MNKPSSTITAATLTGLGVTFFIFLFNNYAPAAWAVNGETAAAATTFFTALAGYFKKENVLINR